MGSKEVEDVVELMQHIQSRLSVKEAARTSVLSKSWLQAWSTIPTLKFRVRKDQNTKKTMELVDVDRTLIRYLRDNIPIKTFDLTIDIENQESASHVENWIRSVASKTCLKEFSLGVFLRNSNDNVLLQNNNDEYYDPDPDNDHDEDEGEVEVAGAGDALTFALPDEILSGENLSKITVRSMWRRIGGIPYVRMTPPSQMIKCVSLRELHLNSVHISEEALHHILSSCSLLVKIELLHSCEGFKTIRVKNLACLYELSIYLDTYKHTALEISNVPNLGVFSYYHHVLQWGRYPLPFNSNVHSISLGSNVTQLTLGGVIPGNACLDMIRSGFPFLESLTLHLTGSWNFESFDFTCASIKRLSLQSCPRILTDVQVHAPKLLFFSFGGDDILPSFSFPVSSLKKITVSLTLNLPEVPADDALVLFIKMREALTLSRRCDLRITTLHDYYNNHLPFNINIDDLRTRLLYPPATNVQQLWFRTIRDECLWERSPIFDAFFEICHPKHVYAQPDDAFRNNNHFCRLMLREVLEKKNKTTTAYWPHHLKQVQIRRRRHQKWKTLTNSHRRFLDGSAPCVYMDFKLNWR